MLFEKIGFMSIGTMEKGNSYYHLFFPFFLPLTSFSKDLSLWLRTAEEGILRVVGFDASPGDDGRDCCCWAAAYFLSASKNEKAGFWSIEEGGVKGIRGMPKNFFTSGILITGKKGEITRKV